MARLHESSDEAEEFPELSTLLQSVALDHARLSSGKATSIISRKGQGTVRELGGGCEGQAPRKYDIQKQSPNLTDKTPEEKQEKRVRKKKSLRVARRLPLSESLPQNPQAKSFENFVPGRKGSLEGEGEPKVNYHRFSTQIQDTVESSSQDYQKELSGNIFGNSADDLKIEHPRPKPEHFQQSLRRQKPREEEDQQRGRRADDPRVEPQPPVVDLISPLKLSKFPLSKHSHSEKELLKDVGEHEYAFNEDLGATLSFVPLKPRSPHKRIEERPFVTPPPSPSKAKLQSPSKSHKIPPSPHRPSIDAFWSQESINEWNDQYSPKKTPRSRRLFVLDEDDEAESSPSSSPRKSPIKSPAKKDKQAIGRKKIFNERKNDLAVSFLQEVDQKVANSQVSSLASSTGGIHIIWSKKLNSTAGRANWKRETLRSKNAEGVVISTTHRHHASIELAEKVIDNEERLHNVLAHEYCHLANFMISNITTSPHGPSFKNWAALVTSAFASHPLLSFPIVVTTKHTYEIEYKYIWQCLGCEVLYKRHSKSIDPARHTCGGCKAGLRQVKPTPRVVNGGGDAGFQGYVKEHFGRVRGEMDCEEGGKKKGGSHGMGDVMGVLGREWREIKAREKEKEKEKEKKEGKGGGEMDEVVRKLDFFDLSVEA